MITRVELNEQARIQDLNQADIQRDYVFGWLISGLYRESVLRNEVVLKGGNALRKGYLPGTRFSGDLDLSSPGGLDGARVLGELNGVCEYVQGESGIPFDVERNRLVNVHEIDDQKTAYKYKLYFHDFLGQPGEITISVRIDVAEFDRLQLAPQRRELIHPYSDADKCATTITCVKLEEALADKLKCLLQRRHSFDLFDLVYGAFMSHGIEVDRSELIRTFFNKTIFGTSPLGAKELLVNLPFDILKGYWGKVLVPATSRFSFDQALEAFREGLDELFGEFGQVQRVAAAFFPSAIRNPILEAGGSRRLLQVRYSGVTRVMEPYSLKFKRRQDGVGQEYFYAWDRTGGRTSGPGIKTMVHSRIEDLQVLDEEFKPRFEVELSKAGEITGPVGFSAQSGPRRGSIHRTQSRPKRAPRYVVTCSVCMREFPRVKYSTQIKAHKDRFGLRCSGRYGSIQGR